VKPNKLEKEGSVRERRNRVIEQTNGLSSGVGGVGGGGRRSEEAEES